MTADSSVSTSTAHLAADRLWQFQLRKENKAILDELQDNNNKRKELLETNEKRFEAGEERILKLEAKIVQLEQEHNKKLQAWEKFKDEQRAQIAELKVQILLHARGFLTEGETFNVMKDRISMTTLENQLIVSNRKSTPKIQSSNSRHLQTTQSYSPSTIGEASSQITQLDVRTKIKEPNITKHPEARRGRKPNKQTLAIPRPTSTIVTTQFPRLNQGRMQLKLYYEQAGSVRSSFVLSTEQSEIEFVNSFIKGVSNQKARDKLTAQLQQIHPSKQKKDGRVEILCNWAELGEG